MWCLQNLASRKYDILERSTARSPAEAVGCLVWQLAWHLIDVAGFRLPFKIENILAGPLRVLGDALALSLEHVALLHWILIMIL